MTLVICTFVGLNFFVTHSKQKAVTEGDYIFWPLEGHTDDIIMDFHPEK